MFRNLMNYPYKRTPLEAIGFYLAYFVALLLLGGIAGALAGLVSGPDSLGISGRAGNFTSITLRSSDLRRHL